MSDSPIPVSLSSSSGRAGGVFRRLHLASSWLRSLTASGGKNENKSGGDHTDDDGDDQLCFGVLRKELEHFCLAECLRQAVTYIESLDYYMIDMKGNYLFRHLIDAERIHYFDCSQSSLSSIVIQVAFAVVTKAPTRITVPHYLKQFLSNDMEKLLGEDNNIVVVSTHDPTYTDSRLIVSFSPFHLLDEDTGRVIISSISPALTDMLRKDIKTSSYLKEKFGDKIFEMTDEFDLLEDVERDVLVQERSSYLLAEVRQCSSFYRSTLFSNDLKDAPVISGRTLLEHVHPYGKDFLASSGPVQTGVGHDSYAVAFASGGSTGRMKFVYRSEWEDQENARYLAKGLFAAGIRKTDTVANFLSAGFWGGMHVFNLALSYTGCGVIPLGPSFSFEEIIDFLQKLRPTAILGMPSFVMTLADHVSRLQQQGDGECDIPSIFIPKVITGGEMMLPEMEKRIRSVLGVSEFLSTGYTSNETGAIGFRCKYLSGSCFHVHENMQNVVIESDTTELGEENTNERIAKGKIIATNLNRTLMPLIHYEIGDMGMLWTNTDGDEKPSCPCGRKLRVLQLLGRCDNRIRLGTEDLYMEDIPKCLQKVDGLSLNFSLEILKSSRQFDHLVIHVEATSPPTADNSAECSRIASHLREEVGRQTQLVWELTEEDTSEGGGGSSTNGDLFVHMMTKKNKLSEAIIEVPEVVVHAPNSLPRNKRTGKIVVLVDKR